MALRRYQHKFLQPLEIDQERVASSVTSKLTTTNLTADTSSVTQTNLTRVTEKAVNQFNSVLNSINGTLTIDVSLGTVILGDLDFSVTTWAFTNVPTQNGVAVTVTVINDGDTGATYGDACTVNGVSISGGVKWSGGVAPTATNNFDVITFTIVKDSAETINVFGSGNTNFS
jgi:hypothetical protein